MSKKQTESGIARIYVREALEKAQNCFLCYLENRFEQRYIDNYLNELVMDASAREKIIESRGFCNYHFYKTFALSADPSSGDGLGLALILKSVTEQLLEDVRKLHNANIRLSDQRKLRFRHPSGSSKLAELIRPITNQIKCPACDHVWTMLQVYTRDFLHGVIEDQQISKLFDARGSICIPHYVMTLFIASRDSDEGFESAIEKIASRQIQSLEKMQMDLSQYIAKQEYRFSEKERLGTEKAIEESLAKVAGKRGIEGVLTRVLKSLGGATP